MTAVQYRDPETEEILDWRYEEAAPAIGQKVCIGFEEYRVLFRWMTVPTSHIIYVQRISQRERQVA